MFDFTNINPAKREAISTTEGPVLIIAGPGTGKTFTLVQRAVYLIEECGIRPEEILMATFTEKAAKELITRITNELSKKNISVNINDMYIGTFHSICLRIIKENIEYSQLKKNYSTLDGFEQQYLVYQNYRLFHELPNFEVLFPDDEKRWKSAETICTIVNNLAEELVSPVVLKEDENLRIRLVGDILETYEKMMAEENRLDFSRIQAEAWRLMKENPQVLRSIQQRIRYLMIDEYQDTNYIQEQIVFMLAGDRKNICVVGDDDQGLYRFRGATIRNILEFPDKFPDGVCQKFYLSTNYRSDGDIVDFYNRWMQSTSWITGGKKPKKVGFEWGKFRFDKNIIPDQPHSINSPAVIKLDAPTYEEWAVRVRDFIVKLKSSGKISDYNQIAILARSVKNSKYVRALESCLEEENIHIYSPRSNKFFTRDEIRLAIGVLLHLFPLYSRKLTEINDPEELHGTEKYYRGCMDFVDDYLENNTANPLFKWMQDLMHAHTELKKNTDYTYAGLLYQMFAFEPFRSLLDVDLSEGIADVRPARNLAQLTKSLGSFEKIYGVNVLTPRSIETNTQLLFDTYLRLLKDNGIQEYEDDSEYAPSGCVSFMTIHQSKGMEFPIVITVLPGQLSERSSTSGSVLAAIEEKYYQRKPFEPQNQKKYFDWWRLYYTAFSRAQDLLILSCQKTEKIPTAHFRSLYNMLPEPEDTGFNINDFTFHDVKDVNLKNSYSFTSHISVYETCSRQYKFFKELDFAPVRTGSMIFGLLVHATIEDIHKAVLRHEEHTITESNITQWFNTNYESLSKAEHAYLGTEQKDNALEQVLRYVEKQSAPGKLMEVLQAEVDVSVVRPDYIVEGKIDLVTGHEGKVDIVDFKSEKKPELNDNPELLERYRNQLNLYAWLVEQRTGQKIDQMHLYYTADESDNPMLSFDYHPESVDRTMAFFDKTVHKIMKKDFSRCAKNSNTCQNCDFRFYCR